jgi:RNA ligase
LIIAKDGAVLSRRFHKFFNIGELPETLPQKIDFTRPFLVLEKLDGSMVAPFMLRNKVRYGTKQGVTSKSEPIEAFVKSQIDIKYDELSEFCLKRGWTPMFEYCSPTAQIVLKYEKDGLQLISVRDNHTGLYLPYVHMAQLAAKYNVPVVRHWKPEEFGLEINSEGSASMPINDKSLPALRQREGVEGFVIRFENGEMYKIKTQWYFSLNKSLDLLKHRSERHLWQSILEEKFDDVKAYLPDDLREIMVQFAEDLTANIEKTARRILETVETARKTHTTKKDMARFVSQQPPIEKGLLFKIAELFDTQPSVTVGHVTPILVEHLAMNVGTTKSLLKVSPLVNNISFAEYTKGKVFNIPKDEDDG